MYYCPRKEGVFVGGVGVRSCQSILGRLKSPKSQIWEFDWLTRFRDLSSSTKLV